MINLDQLILNLYSSSGLITFTVLIVLLSVTIKKYKKKTVSINYEEKINNWNPEPLFPISEQPKQENFYNYIVDEKPGHLITINGKQCINFATHNYLCFIEDESIEESSIKCIEKYGVGSCGPRGFYGTIDVHLDLEHDLAKFMKVEEAVVYSYGFSTVASAVAAYIKRKDIIFVDEEINFAVQTGLIASRATIYYFKHNDMKHLESLFQEQDERDQKNKKESKRFLIVEGIYYKTGEICPLNEIIELRSKYRARLFVDESISFGTIGKTGRGITEYFNVSPEEIDMIIGSLEFSFGSVGGFCLGSSFIIEHHTLSGAGYCFSASLAPFLTVAANTSLKLLINNPSLMEVLKNNCNLLSDVLSQPRVTEIFTVEGHKDSPIKFLYLKDSFDDDNVAMETLKKVSTYCIESGFAVIVPTYLDQEVKKPFPCLRLTCNVKQTKYDMNNLIQTLCDGYAFTMKIE